MIQSEYVVWNPANVKTFAGIRKAAILKPNREPIRENPVAPPRVYANFPFSTERR